MYRTSGSSGGSYDTGSGGGSYDTGSGGGSYDSWGGSGNDYYGGDDYYGGNDYWGGGMEDMAAMMAMMMMMGGGGGYSGKSGGKGGNIQVHGDPKFLWHSRNTSPKFITTCNPKCLWLLYLDVSPFQRGYFQVRCLFARVYKRFDCPKLQLIALAMQLWNLSLKKQKCCNLSTRPGTNIAAAN